MIINSDLIKIYFALIFFYKYFFYTTKIFFFFSRSMDNRQARVFFYDWKAYSKSSTKAFFSFSLSHSRSHSRIERAVEYLCCFSHLLNSRCVYAVYMPNKQNICFPCNITTTLPLHPLARCLRIYLVFIFCLTPLRI